jgi:xanthine dehydrogenase accessory factor
MSWLSALADLAQRGVPTVMVTVAKVRGHAPRGAGAKLLVTTHDLHGSVGGGDLERTAIARARTMLAAGQRAPELLQRTLTPSGGEHGVQCCGGEVTLLLEPVHDRRPTVAIFGAGHVGKALLQALAPLPIDLVVVDSRAAELDAAAPPNDPQADVVLRHAPVPESALPELPSGAHLLVLTHDHAEDLAILDMALRRPDLGFLGLIGSSAKWAHFRGRLLELGHDEAALARVTTPIGLPGVPGKRPAAIAIAVAAQLLTVLDLPEGDV